MRRWFCILSLMLAVRSWGRGCYMNFCWKHHSSTRYVLVLLCIGLLHALMCLQSEILGLGQATQSCSVFIFIHSLLQTIIICIVLYAHLWYSNNFVIASSNIKLNIIFGSIFHVLSVCNSNCNYAIGKNWKQQKLLSYIFYLILSTVGALCKVSNPFTVYLH